MLLGIRSRVEHEGSEFCSKQIQILMLDLVPENFHSLQGLFSDLQTTSELIFGPMKSKTLINKMEKDCEEL